ncbi:MAG TPA: tripartite tricarboxylate transporter substrate binding protein [Burkholderiales bacterium]|jgi:tripartite-type tricarboxylate transporter receptor subunit TctC|nr:tripartite tricarboxylate transporter substrate binding protein [Burkholderiales bacterium]
MRFGNCTLTIAMFIAGLAAAPGFAAERLSSAYPVKSIRLIAPFPPGGGNDTMARAIGAKVTEAWGQQVIVDNRAGANGIVACEILVAAPPDGYTLLMANVGTNAINPALYKKLPYDPIKAFAPVSLLGMAPNILVVPAATPVSTVSELVALAKSRPGKLTYGSNGIGSSQHLSGVMFGTAFGIDIVHVPYKGTGPAIVDLISGQISMSFSNALAVVQHIKTNRLKAIAVTSLKRSPALPSVPAIAETVPGFSATSWWGIVAPARTPDAILTALSEEIARALDSASMKEQLDRQGVEPRSSTPSEFRAFMQSELVKWAKVVKDSRATAD